MKGDIEDIEIVRYTPLLKKEWDDFVDKSINATFLFNRNYMDYHADRFEDNSYLFYRRKKLIALFPATPKDGYLSSHAGLTYGGILAGEKTSSTEIIGILNSIIRKASEENFKGIIYKSIPYIYHRAPCQSDLYALFRNNARLTARCLSSTLDLEHKIKFQTLRLRGIKKAAMSGINIRESKDYAPFYEILSENLKKRYGVLPVHTLQEMELLASEFPDNIKLFGAYDCDNLLAGVLCYDTPICLHTQYIAASENGKGKGALDILFDRLINVVAKGKRYFDFGISTEKGGQILNENLLFQKEGFGGRGICYDTYEILL